MAHGRLLKLGVSAMTEDYASTSERNKFNRSGAGIGTSGLDCSVRSEFGDNLPGSGHLAA
jgi:hypothetical protein